MSSDPGAANSPATARRSVLLVDDDADVRYVTNVSLARLGGFRVEGVGTAREAMAALAKQRPDVVLLDVELPDSDGPRVAAEIAAQPGLEGLPIIFLSGYPMDDLAEQLRDLGVVGAIQKPFDPMTLARKVKELVGWA